MKLKGFWISLLIVSLSLGTGHAIRGQFGHEQGAAWAGAIGALSLVMVAGRNDWYRKSLNIAMSMAVGWGAGGIISYGQIAGRYAQSDNFPNVLYGLSMLFIIGALYGVLGGGLTGLSLENTPGKRIKWGSLMAEMTAGGIVFYGLIVMQLGILMTPPRDETWAFCAGAGFALIWHLARNEYHSSLRVAFFTAIGGGFGFAFGTFFHVLMNMLEIHFNTWNMAEYSIGFFGGAGLAYGVFTSEWPEETSIPKKWEISFSMLLIKAIVPLIIYRESFSYGMFLEKLQQIPNASGIAAANSVSALIITFIVIFSGWLILIKSGFNLKKTDVLILFIVYSLSYSILSYIVTGLFQGVFLSNSNHHLYVLNIGVVALLSYKKHQSFIEQPVTGFPIKKWSYLLLAMAISLFVMAFISIFLHGETDGSYDRFPF